MGFRNNTIGVDIQQAAEELLGKDLQKMSKMNPSITTATRINGLQGLTTFPSNSIVFYAMLAEVERKILMKKEKDGMHPSFT